MTAPLPEDRLAEIEATLLGEWLAGSWRTEYIEGDGDEPACYRVKSAEGIVLATLPDWAGPIATFLADAHESVEELLADNARLRAEVARLTPRSALHSPAVDQLVDMVRAELANGPCWTLSAPGGQAALVGTNPAGGLRFVGVFRRATLADASGLDLLTLGRDLVPLPQYTGGIGRWAWSRDIPGQPVTLGSAAAR